MALTGCCCCFSLRTGGLILAVFFAISDLVLFVSGVCQGEPIKISAGVAAIFYFLCIYAIVKERPGLMIPALIWSLITSIAIFIFLILLIIGYVILKDVSVDEMPHYQKELWALLQIGISVISITFIVMGAITSYYSYVLYSLYQLLKNPTRISITKNVV